MTTGLNQIKCSMIWVEKQLKFLRYHLKKYEYLTGEDLGTNQTYFTRLNSSILY